MTMITILHRLHRNITGFIGNVKSYHPEDLNGTKSEQSAEWPELLTGSGLQPPWLPALNTRKIFDALSKGTV